MYRDRIQDEHDQQALIPGSAEDGRGAGEDRNDEGLHGRFCVERAGRRIEVKGSRVGVMEACRYSVLWKSGGFVAAPGEDFLTGSSAALPKAGRGGIGKSPAGHGQ